MKSVVTVTTEVLAEDHLPHQDPPQGKYKTSVTAKRMSRSVLLRLIARDNEGRNSLVEESEVYAKMYKSY